MQKQLVVNITATKADVSYPVAGYDSPFLVGNTVVMAVTKSTDYDGGDLHIETDNSHDSAGDPVWADVRAAAAADGADTLATEYFEFTLGDNIRVGTGTFVAGICEITLLAQ